MRERRLCKSIFGKARSLNVMKKARREKKTRQISIDKQYYDESAYYEHINLDTDLNTPFQKYRISKILQLYTPSKNERVVDLGCGWGTVCFTVAPLCREVTGVDVSKKSIELCNKRLAKSQHSNIKLVCADAENTGLESQSYDVIISADLFEHMYPDSFEKALDECKRVLKKGGQLAIWTPNAGHLFELMRNHKIFLKGDISHIGLKSMDYLLDELHKRHFLIKKSYFAESHLPVIRTLEKLFIPFLPFARRRIAILAEKTE